MNDYNDEEMSLFDETVFLCSQFILSGSLSLVAIYAINLYMDAIIKSDSNISASIITVFLSIACFFFYKLFERFLMVSKLLLVDNIISIYLSVKVYLYKRKLKKEGVIYEQFDLF